MIGVVTLANQQTVTGTVIEINRIGGHDLRIGKYKSA
jgi:hypothetical protein